jgi:alkylation response protein AidB-like acyl-CoA dehydrogenase
MRWELADEQMMFQESFRGWLERFATPEAVRGWLRSGDPSAFEDRMTSEGWFGVGTPEDLGGQGGGLLEMALTAEELGRCAAPSGAWLGSVLAIPALPREAATLVLEGGASVALLVPADRPADGTVTVLVDSEQTLVGKVDLVVGADRADRFVVPALTSNGLGLFLVDAGPRVSVAPRTLLDGSRSAADVRLDGVAGQRLDVDAESVLAQAALRSAVLVAADTLGATARMLALAVEYSKQREQFGVPIGSFQAVKHAAATMLVTVESSRSIVYYAAVSVDQGHPDRLLHAATAKAQVTGPGAALADTALTLHGAIGYTWEHDLQRYYKRTKLNERLFGSPAAWNERIAERLSLLPSPA